MIYHDHNMKVQENGKQGLCESSIGREITYGMRKSIQSLAVELTDAPACGDVPGCAIRNKFPGCK